MSQLTLHVSCPALWVYSKAENSLLLIIIVILFPIMVTGVEHLIFATHCARQFTYLISFSQQLCKVGIIMTIFKETEAQRN